MPNAAKTMPRLSWAEVCARRLERHALAAPLQGARPAAVVHAIGAAHAQVPSAAEASIGLRSADLTRADIRAALWDEHSLIKTFGPRGTVHLLAAQDLPMWTGALGAIPPVPDGLPQEARMTPEQTEQVIEAIARALDDAELTIEELGAAVVARAGAWAGRLTVPAWTEMWPLWRPAVYPAAQRGILCFGPNRGRKVTYTNPRRWLPGFQPAEGQTALAGLVRRYLHAYGPATPEQFAQWLNAPRRWAADLFVSLAGALRQVAVEGAPAWTSAGDAAPPPGPPAGVRLLPYFDAYVVGCHPRERVFPGRAAEHALSRGQAGNFPVLLVKGIVAGVWRQQRAGRHLDITVEPFARLTGAQRRELDAQAERLAAFLDSKPRLTIGPVSGRGHL